MGVDQGDVGGATLIQRFGPTADMDLRMHELVVHSVHWRGTARESVFVEEAPPSDEMLQGARRKIIARMPENGQFRSSWL